MDASGRLSEQAQRQLERGASKFEDISLGENRPTQLVKRYGNLYSEARLDAMDALDELDDMADADTLKVKLLLSIVVVSLSCSLFLLLFVKDDDKSVQSSFVSSSLCLPIVLSCMLLGLGFTFPLTWTDFLLRILPCLITTFPLSNTRPIVES